MYRIPKYHVSLVRDSHMSVESKQIRESKTAAQIIHQYLDGADREHFVVLLLDQKNNVIGVNTVSTGSLTASVVHPREVFKPAILCNAAAIICAHNHPSGNPEPSREDRALTTRLVDAGKLLGITILDHIVIGDGTQTYYSFSEQGLIGIQL
jgi:DNA repair protein RadC